MYKIHLLLLDRTFEHDVFELIRAFYPGTEIHTSYGETDGEWDLSFRVWREKDRFLIRYQDKEHNGVASASIIEGQSSDALILCGGQAGAGSEEAGQEAGFRGETAQNDGPERNLKQEADFREKAERSAGPERNLKQEVNSGEKAERSAGSGESSKEGRPRRRTQEEHDLRKKNKDSLKYALYQVLVKLTGRTLPWGNLTGIRPAKLVMGMLEEGKKNTEIAAEMRERYLVSPQKTALAITIANREREILKNIDYENGYSLYIGIPFCPSICLYCSFSSYPLKQWKNRVGDYLDALCREIRAVSAMMKGRKLDTVYVGGGTPTTLEPDQLRRLLDETGSAFGFDDLEEFTVEAGRPDSITGEKLQALKEYPISRISVNPQTMNQETLDIIGRRHTVEQTRQAFYLAREHGFDNINMDLIVGLPGEDITMVERTLEEVRKLGPDSLTVHSLAVKRAARLNIFRDRYQEMTFENSQEIMDLAMRTAYEMGMGPYYLYRQKNMKGNFENVGYARVDKAGIYNILIMEEKQPIIALGAGGSSKLVLDHGRRIERVENVKDVAGYIARIDEMIDRKRAGITAWL